MFLVLVLLFRPRQEGVLPRVVFERPALPLPPVRSGRDCGVSYDFDIPIAACRSHIPHSRFFSFKDPPSEVERYRYTQSHVA